MSDQINASFEVKQIIVTFPTTPNTSATVYWGGILGTLSNQTDLINAINAKANDSAVVHNTTDETIAGIKTFSSFPISPSNAPSSNYQFANKKYVDDIFASIDISGKQNTITGGATTITSSNLTINKALVSDGSGKVAVATTTATELGYIAGVTSAIQTQIDGKVTANGAITGATKTKITYDTNGLVTAGADATTADIADSTNKRYVTDANQTTLGAIGMVLSGGYSGATVGASTTSYMPVNGLTNTFSTEANRQTVVPITCTAKNFFIRTDTTQTATGSFVHTVRKNGADTSIVVTIAAGSAAGLFSNTSNTASFTAGDKICLKCVNNGTASSAQLQGGGLMLYV